MSIEATGVLESEEIVVTQGNAFTVELEDNPTTGYQWEMLNPERVSPKLAVTYEYIGGQQGTRGGGCHTLTFRADQLGEVCVEMIHSRNLKGIKTAIERRNYSVTVKARQD